MKRYILRILTLLFVLLVSSGIQAQTLPERLSETAQMSILVASPSAEEAYTMYGHAGYRVYDAEQGLDLTFNYGIFQFDDTFLYRFIKGKTDYLVLAQPTSSYMEEYLGRGSRVKALMLNLRPEEKQKAWDYLKWNIQPEHRVYRYNFFKDNCATRPLWLVDMAVGGLKYEALLATGKEKIQTWRDEINNLEAKNPWLVLGTDLAVGLPADSVMTLQDRAFSPRRLEEVLRQARRSDGTVVLEQVEQYEPTVTIDQGATLMEYLNPSLVSALLLVIGLYAYTYRIVIKGRSLSRFWDISIYALVGLAGCLLCYISFLSEHPFVAPNYNIILFNPLHLFVGSVLIAVPHWKQLAVCYHFVTFVTAIVFMCVEGFLPQHINDAVIRIAFLLSIVASSRLVENGRSKTKHGTY